MPGRKAGQAGASPMPAAADDAANDAILSITLGRANLVFLVDGEAPAERPPPLEPGMAPPVRLEVVHGQDEPSTGPPTTAVHGIQSGGWAATYRSATAAVHTCAYHCSSTHRFRHRKGADLATRLLNTQVIVRLCNATSGALLGSAIVDLLPLVLGVEATQQLLPLESAGACDPLQPLKLLPGSSVVVTLKTLHQQAPAAGPAADAPFAVVAAEAAPHCNVLQFSPTALTPLPAPLLEAVAAAAGALSFAAAIHLPGEAPPAVAVGAVVEGSRVCWTGVAPRVWLSPQSVVALKGRLEAGEPLVVELARQLPVDCINLSDPAAASYHALLALDCTNALLEPGRSAAAGEATVVGQFAAAAPGLSIGRSALPAHSSPVGPRVKPIEEAPAVVEGSTPVCSWLRAGTKLAVQLRLARPLHPSWCPPQRPTTSLSELLPQPAVLPQSVPSARDVFRSQVKVIVQSLLHVQAEATDAPSNKSPAKPGPPPCAPAADVPTLPSLLYALQHSGHYLAMRQRLLHAVAAVVREHQQAHGGCCGTPAQAAQLHADVYAALLEDMRIVLAEAAAEPPLLPAAVEAPDVAPEQALRSMMPAWLCATHWEAVGDVDRARAVLQDAVAQLDTAESWTDLGVFEAAHGVHVQAMECVHAALRLNQHHPSALLVLTLLELRGALSGDSAASKAAVVLCHGLRDMQPGSALPWALLALAYRQQGPAAEADARSCHQEVVRLAKVAAAAAKQAPPAEGDGAATPPTVGAPSSATSDPAVQHDLAAWLDPKLANTNGYLAAAELLAHLRLAVPAERALAAATGLKDAAAKPVERLQLCRARVYGQAADAIKALTAHQAARGDGSEEVDMLLQAGAVHFEGGSWTAAKQHLQRAWLAAPDAFPITALLRLGECLLREGEFAAAGGVYQVALERGSSACAWLGVGAAALYQGELGAADAALSEANRLDPHHPRVWAHLALLALKQGHEEEAEQAGMQALACGLADGAVLGALADEWARLARWRAAEAMLTLALQRMDSVRLRCRLAQALLAQRKCAACEAQLQAAGGVAGANEDDNALLAAGWAALRAAWPAAG